MLRAFGRCHSFCDLLRMMLTIPSIRTTAQTHPPQAGRPLATGTRGELRALERASSHGNEPDAKRADAERAGGA